MSARRPRLAGALLLALLGGVGLGGGLAAPSYAAGTGATIDHVETGNGTLTALVSVPGGQSVDLSSVSATIGGARARATAQQASSSTTVSRTTVLAIDTSDSMAGERIREAKKAALAYLATVPANVQVGIVAFADSVRQVLAPSLDRDAARTAIGSLALGPHTALYDGVTAAVTASGSVGQREVLVLSDGRNTTGTTLPSVLRTIRGSGVKVDAVSLDQTQNPALQQLARAGRGSVLDAADPTALTAAYASEAKVLARQVLVSVTLPADQKSGDANLAVTLSSGGRTYTGTAFVQVRAATAPTSAGTPQPVHQGLAIPRGVALVVVVMIGVALLLLVVALTSKRVEPAVSIEDQIGTYGASGRRPRSHRDASPEGSGTSLAGQARDAASRALASNHGLEALIEHRLDAAGMAIKPAEWVLAHAGIAIAAALVGGLLGSGSPILIVIFLAVGVLGPWMYLGIKRSRRLHAFDENLAETLQLLSGSLSAGLSLAQSLDTVVREGTEPVASEFRRVIVESRLGVGLEDAMEGVGTRMRSKDFAWVVMAIRIQREVGGNLAELLNTVAATLRERAYLRRHVRALSAEGRLSCWILGGLPPVFVAYISLVRPEYVHPMYTTALGLMMCVVIVVLLVVGIVWMSRVSKVEMR